MSDQRRELDALRYKYDKERQEWEQQQRRLLNQIEELERKLKPARDELAEARLTINDQRVNRRNS